MKDHLKNLKDYIEDDFTYSRYKENPNDLYTNFDWICIDHVKDIEWAVSELESLYELVDEMKKKYEKK